mmetsp:Transcript_12531/g.25815  ORF Transcript_12531/g.25815 Transcript_12531/m.25815 type:complete len:228 (+) Transcript_12531:882-1565(+)
MLRHRHKRRRRRSPLHRRLPGVGVLVVAHVVERVGHLHAQTRQLARVSAGRSQGRVGVDAVSVCVEARGAERRLLLPHSAPNRRRWRVLRALSKLLSLGALGFQVETSQVNVPSSAVASEPPRVVLPSRLPVCPLLLLLLLHALLEVLLGLLLPETGHLSVVHHVLLVNATAQIVQLFLIHLPFVRKCRPFLRMIVLQPIVKLLHCCTGPAAVECDVAWRRMTGSTR